jgi:hypothetical protein
MMVLCTKEESLHAARTMKVECELAKNVNRKMDLAMT